MSARAFLNMTHGFAVANFGAEAIEEYLAPEIDDRQERALAVIALGGEIG